MTIHPIWFTLFQVPRKIVEARLYWSWFCAIQYHWNWVVLNHLSAYQKSIRKRVLSHLSARWSPHEPSRGWAQPSPIWLLEIGRGADWAPSWSLSRLSLKPLLAYTFTKWHRLANIDLPTCKVRKLDVKIGLLRLLKALNRYFRPFSTI